MKISELTGAALDWAVAKCEGVLMRWERSTHDEAPLEYSPSTDWAQGGPIIEREWIDLHCVNDALWEAEINASAYHNRKNGPNTLDCRYAVLRCVQVGR
jgi:hypothetical protein